MSGNLHSRDQTLGTPGHDPSQMRLAAAWVNADVILEPSGHDPRSLCNHPAEAMPEPDRRAVAPFPHPAAVPQPVVARGDGVRVMPLAGFVWGGTPQSRTGARPVSSQPRGRGDHVIMMLTRSSVQVVFQGARHRIGQGRIAFIPAGTAFLLQPPPDAEGWALLLPPDLGLGLPVGFPLAFRKGVPHPADAELIEPAFRALGHSGPDGVPSIATACHLGLLALALSRAADHPQIQDTEHLQNLASRPLTKSFLELAEQHLADGYTIADMAGALGCSQAQLDRACRESRGRTPLDLLYALRLNRATELLRSSRLGIDAVARTAGYSSLCHFIRVFVTATGRTPEAFRRAEQNPSARDG